MERVSSVQNWMRYCPKCGARQVHLQWVDLSSPDGMTVERLNVDPSEVHGKKVRLYNMDKPEYIWIGCHRPPSVNWINCFERGTVGRFCFGRQHQDFDLRFDTLALREAFGKLDTDVSWRSTHADFPVQMSNIQPKIDSGQQTLELPVFLAKRPFISPNLNLFRFLSWERLEEA